MNITYLHHSGFLAETETALLLFDFTGGPLPHMDPDKELIVFVSHRHGDHFSPDIFQLPRLHPRTVFVLSDDIWENRVPEEHFSRTCFVDPGSVVHPAQNRGLTVTAFSSTDEGVAFLVEADGHVLFHAGDLNDWQWNGLSKAENNNMHANYLAELKKIKATGRIPDAAMLPLDGRQEDLFFLGLHQFMTQIGAKAVFPMHFWGDFHQIRKLKELPCTEGYRDRIADITAEGQSFQAGEDK